MLKITVAAACVLLASSVYAQTDQDYNAMNQDGYGDVGELIKSMTPEQRAAVMRQAEKKQHDLQKLTPEQLQQLQDQLHKEADTIDLPKVDPAKLDTSKAKSTQATMKDMNTYEQKYNQGKIKNAVIKVRPKDEDDEDQ